VSLLVSLMHLLYFVSLQGMSLLVSLMILFYSVFLQGMSLLVSLMHVLYSVLLQCLSLLASIVVSATTSAHCDPANYSSYDFFLSVSFGCFVGSFVYYVLIALMVHMKLVVLPWRLWVS
jgi:hypothetical protein